MNPGQGLPGFACSEQSQRAAGPAATVCRYAPRMNPIFVLVAMLGGAVTPFQAGMNRELGGHLGSPVLATLNNFVGGSVLAALAALAIRTAWPSGHAAGSAPWWSWLGGVGGFTLVLCSTIAVSRLGSTGLVVALVAGQLACSVVIDHFGLINHAVREVTLPRVAGLLLVGAGVVLVTRY